MVTQYVWVGIAVGIFVAGIGMGYAALQGTMPDPMNFGAMSPQQMQQAMQDPDFRQTMMNEFRNNPQSIQNMMNPMMNDPKLQSQMRGNMMQNSQFMQGMMGPMMDDPEMRRQMMDTMSQHQAMMQSIMQNPEMMTMMKQNMMGSGMME